MSHLKVRPLNDALKAIARVELNENDARIPADIATLRDWIEKQPHLKARTDDQYLLTFLRGSKHSLEKAKSKIEHFYTIKTMLPEVFGNVSMNKKFIALAHAGAMVWPERPKHLIGPEIFITRFDNNFDFKRFKLMDIVRYYGIGMEYALNKIDSSVVCGFVVIYDLAKISYGFYAQADFVLMKKLSIFFDKSVPLRLKAVHIINCPKEAQNILQFVKSLVLEKHRKSFFIHKNLEDLYKYVPQACLPVEYGGTNGAIAEIVNQNECDLSNFNDYFLSNDQYGVDERLRANTKVNDKSIFGLEGSFRKLDID